MAESVNLRNQGRKWGQIRKLKAQIQNGASNWSNLKLMKSYGTEAF